jgi:hypothetical protein
MPLTPRSFLQIWTKKYVCLCSVPFKSRPSNNHSGTQDHLIWVTCKIPKLGNAGIICVTSGTGLALIPECRWCRTDAADYRPKCRCRSNFFPAFQHVLSSIICQHQKVSLTLPLAVYYRRADCLMSTTSIVWTRNVYAFRHSYSFVKARL